VRDAADHYQRAGYWDEARDIVRSRQTAPAPTPRIAEAEVADATRARRRPRGGPREALGRLTTT
jgi:hypothetical protein